MRVLNLGSFGNHVSKVAEFVLRNKLDRSEIQHITVSHDDDCGVFAAKRCDCDPDISLGRPKVEP